MITEDDIRTLSETEKAELEVVRVKYKLIEPSKHTRNTRSTRSTRRAKRRLLREQQAAGEFTDEQFLYKFRNFYGGRCYYCGKSLIEKNVQKEHRVPLVRGGTNYLSNIVPSCWECNRKKNIMTETEYREKYNVKRIRLSGK